VGGLLRHASEVVETLAGLVAERLARALAGLFFVFAGSVVPSPPSNNSGALVLRLGRVLPDIGVHNWWNSCFCGIDIFYVVADQSGQ
jgi:hypothetical protein